MNAIKVLTPILLFCFCWTFQLDAQKATYNFSNRNRTHDILLSVNGKPKATIKKAQKGSLDLNIGDVVTVSVPGHDELTWYPIYITEQVPKADPIIINPNVVWFTNDSRSVGTPVLNYYYNTRGIHIHDFDPQIVSSSFTTSRIFEGISKDCIDYELSDNSQFIYTEGFFYADNNSADENVASTLTRNKDDYKRSFHAKLGASFPIPKAKGVKGSFDFGYKKTNQQTLGNTSYNWSESKKVFTYDILIQDISRVRMHPDFLDYIEQMAKNRHTVQDFVKKFGTHYPTKISYGGQYFKYVSMEATDYAQAEKEGWNVGLGAKKSKDGTKTVKRTRGGWTETGSNESSQVASIDLQFGEETETSEQNQLKKTRRKAMYIGGTGLGDNWSVSPDNATAVKVEIARIEELFYPHILKNDWTESKCMQWRDAIRREVQKQIDALPTIKAASRVKTRRFRVRTQKLHKTYEVDDTDKRIKGHVWLVSKTPSVKAVEPSYQNGAAISSIWKEDKFADLFNKGPIAPMHQSKYGKWQVFEQTSDANGKFAPIKFEAGGHIYEAGIFGGQDRLDFTRGQKIELGQLSDQVVPHVMKLENNKTLAERYHVEITLEFKPTYDFGDLFGTFSNNRSARNALQTLPNAKVSKPSWKQPIERNAKPVKFYSKNSLSLAQAQAIAKQNGWTLATGNDIQAAFIQHKLDVYAFGQLADGRFAVPVQKDHSNFKKGPNIGAVGGNQGFFYTVPTTAPKATPVTTTTSEGPANIALNKPAKQSSNLGNQPHKYGANFANDGDINKQNKGGNIIMCTDRQANPWWEVDLQGTYNIQEIKLYNRINCCPDRLANFTVLVSNTPFTANAGGMVFTKNQAAPSGQGGKGTYKGNATGRYVRIYLENTNYLSIPEIEIFGTPTSAPVTATPVSSTIKPLENGYVRMQNSWKKANYIHNQKGKLEEGQIQPNWLSAQWKLVSYAGGWVNIQNRWKPDLLLNNNNGKLEVVKIANNRTSALWRIVPVHSGWVKIQSNLYVDQYIHNQNGKIEVGKIDPNWASAMWKVQ